MGSFSCRISKAFHAHFTCSLKGWKLDINKIKPKQFLRWGLLSSRSALAWGFFWVCCSRACFDRCCWALLLHLRTGQASQKAAALFAKLPSAQPSRPLQKLIPSTPSYTCQLKHSLYLLSILQEWCTKSPVFLRNMTLIFAVWKSQSVFKHFFLHDRPSVRG